MDIEKAIWRLESCLMCDDCTTCASHDKAIEEGIKALREVDVLRKAVAEKDAKLLILQKWIKELEEIAKS